MSKLEDYTVEQLKKIKDGLKTKTDEIKLKSVSVLDKFTSIDELIIDNTIALKQLIEEQRDTNRMLMATNKILLALYIQENADGTYTPVNPTEIDTTGIIEALEGGGEERTRIKTLPNETITGKKVVFETTGKGRLIEILLKGTTDDASNKSYSLRIIADNTTAYEDSYTNYESRNYFERDMTCYEDTQEDKYILQIQDIIYEDSLVVEVYESTATFEQIYVKYHEVV